MEEKILVTKSSLPPIEEYMEEIRSLWETHWLTNMGEKHRKFEEQLKEFLQIPHVSLTVNGHMALENIIRALQIGGGGYNHHPLYFCVYYARNCPVRMQASVL